MVIRSHVAAVLSLLGLFANSSLAQKRPTDPNSNQKGNAVTKHAIGPFDVKLTPQDDKGDPNLGRMIIDKQFHGDIEGMSKGQMLTGMSEVKGAGSYVAIEKVDATLQGRKGTFILQHIGIMVRGAPSLTITVVPDSGTGQLVGLTGKMNINIAEGGKHSYDLEYTLANSQ
jgi:Protein of unknown function (DUF3224)